MGAHAADNPAWVREVLDFWFAELGESGWFSRDAGIDERIRARFLALHARLRADEGASVAGALLVHIQKHHGGNLIAREQVVMDDDAYRLRQVRFTKQLRPYVGHVALHRTAPLAAKARG